MKIGTTYSLHAKAPDMKRFLMVGRGGSLVGRRLFAIMFHADDEAKIEKLETQKIELEQDNPGWVFEYREWGK